MRVETTAPHRLRKIQPRRARASGCASAWWTTAAIAPEARPLVDASTPEQASCVRARGESVARKRCTADGGVADRARDARSAGLRRSAGFMEPPRRRRTALGGFATGFHATEQAVQARLIEALGEREVSGGEPRGCRARSRLGERLQDLEHARTPVRDGV